MRGRANMPTALGRSMAIYHLSHGIVSRSSGRSSVQSVAYITGTQLHETRRDLNISYQNRHSDIAFTDTLAPKHAPPQFHNLNVWDHLENFEDIYAVKRFPNCLKSRDKYLNSAQTGQTIVVALPRELEVSVAKELVEEFALTRFVSRGLIVTYAIHDDEGNPHAHLQISRHAVNAKGELIWAKDREIVRRKALFATRKLWANLSNQYLEREGFDARITEKSYADLGINLEPTRHRGWVAYKLGAMGINSYVVAENAAIFAHNQAMLIANPAEILPEITSQTATFTQTQLLKAIQKRIGDDDKIVAAVFESALQQAVVVGEGIDGQIRYTSQTYQDLEAEAIKTTATLINTPFAQSKLSRESSEVHLAANFAYLAKAQKDAVLGLTQNQSLAVLIGRAGAGKTTTLKAVCQIYQKVGHRVIGTALSAMAAENLAQETGIKTATLHSWLYRWERYQSAQAKFLSFTNVMEEGIFKQLDWYQDLKRFESAKLTKDTILILDEAGMVGTLQWGELLKQVQNAGAKLIAAGDDHQFKAIAAGDFFREIKHQAESQVKHQSEVLTNFQDHCQDSQIPHLFNLKEIRRQQYSWMQEASHQLAELNIQAGLSIYEQKGHIHQTNRESLSTDIATAYLDKLKAGFSEPQTGLVLAFTNAQTKTINQAIREQLKQNGMIDKEDLVEINGHSFARGDRIVFLKNTKTLLTIMDVDGVVQPEKSIKNGTQGSIAGVDNQGNIRIQLADNCYTMINAIDASPKVAIGQDQPESIRQYTYTQITHGYAVTTHKAQGQTVDFAMVAASKHMDAKGLYVAMTRHRDDVQLFYTKENFASFKALAHHLSRFEPKDLVKDYTILPENEVAWQRVQEYKLCTLDAAHQIAECRRQEAEANAINHNPNYKNHQSGNSNLSSDAWQTYQQIKQDQINLAKEILQDFKAHQLYINQAGLTQEMLQITTGQKARPLSLVETKAKITVELYGEMAHLAREIWNNISKTHPGSKCYSHPDYAKFNAIRRERSILAQTIGDNYPLHREFVKQLSRIYGINRQTIEAQQYQFKQHQTSEQSQEKLWQTQDNHHLIDNQQGHYAKSTNHQTQLKQTFQDEPSFIKQALNAKMKDLAYQLLGKPQTQKATEWRYGNKGSISIHVAGHKQGLYSNFETGESGNALKLIQDQLNLDHKQAFKWGVAWLGNDYHQSSNRTAITQTPKLQSQAKPEWTPIFPVPTPNTNTNTEVDLTVNRSLAYLLKATQEIARYAYQDADGNLLGYVVRLEDHQGHKITPTLTYCCNQAGKEQWRWQGFGNDRPLYGLEQLKQKPTSPVLIVEGEKTAEAAKALFPEYAVVTWNGGCGAVQKADWTVLKNRDITIWPDNDQPGLNAAAKITAILKDQGNQAIKTVDLSLHPTLPHKWDLADKVPEGITIKEILANVVDYSQTMTQSLATTYEKIQATQEQTVPPIDITTIRHICKNHYMGYRITHENTEFIIKVTNDTYKELQQWTRLSGFTKDDSKLEVQAALTAVYTDLAKVQIDKDKYNVNTNTLERAINIGAIAGKIRIENPRSLTDDLDVVQSAALQHERYEKVIAELVAEKPPTPDLTNVAKTAILKATFRCLSMTGFHISKEMSAKALAATKIACGRENDRQKAQTTIGVICEQLAKEAPPTMERPLTIQEQREKSAVDYINTQIITKNHPWIAESIIEIVKMQLARDPMLALDTWKNLTKDDNCFTPMSFTEMQNKTQEATMWLERSKTNLTAEIHDKLQTTLITNPEAVIQHCHKLQLQLDKTRQYNINKDYHLQSSCHDRDNSRTAKEHQPLAKLEGDEKFRKEIISHPEIQTQTQRQLTESKEPKIHEVHRGFER